MLTENETPVTNFIHVTAKKRNNFTLTLQLRKNSKNITAGNLYEALNIKKLNALFDKGIL